MTIRRKMALPVALALGVLGTMVVAQMASATHPRPKGATPLRVSLVPAYTQCPTGTGNRQHGPPLAVLSCTPPTQTSHFLTVGTPDAWPGTAAKSNGFVLLKVKATSPEDVLITANITDVRCRANGVSAGCGSANTDNANLPDYAGEINGVAQIRITDHFNGAIGAGGGTEPATANDLPFSVQAPCANTADQTVGGTCATVTSANAAVPGSVQDAKRANVEVQTINIQDGGTDGIGQTTNDNTLFESQGIFIP
jgi:hypothetical protein